MSSESKPYAVGNPMRCTAHTRLGDQCKSWAIHGANVCRMHGGAAPQVKRKAAERLADIRDLAAMKFRQEIEAGLVEPKILADVCVKFTELVETLEGRVSNRTEVITPDAVEAEIARLEAQFASE